MCNTYIKMLQGHGQLQFITKLGSWFCISFDSVEHILTYLARSVAILCHIVWLRRQSNKTEENTKSQEIVLTLLLWHEIVNFGNFVTQKQKFVSAALIQNFSSSWRQPL